MCVRVECAIAILMHMIIYTFCQLIVLDNRSTTEDPRYFARFFLRDKKTHVSLRSTGK